MKIINQSLWHFDNFLTNWTLSCNQIRWRKGKNVILSCHYFPFIFDEKITHWRGTATSNIIFSFLIDTSQLRQYFEIFWHLKLLHLFLWTGTFLISFFRLNNSILYLWLTDFFNKIAFPFCIISLQNSFVCCLVCPICLNHVVQTTAVKSSNWLHCFLHKMHR